MATTINIDILSYTNYPKIVPVINVEHPVYDQSVTEYELLKLIQLPNYRIFEAGTQKIINGTNISKYFPHGGGGGGGEGGVTSYPDLTDLPQINGTTLKDNKTAAQLNLMSIPSASSSTKVGQILTVKSITDGKITDVSSVDPSTIVEDLDVSEVTLNKNQTLASIKEENGKISSTIQDIEIGSNEVVTMTNYVNDNKSTTAGTIKDTDTLNVAIGKLDKGLTTKQNIVKNVGSATKGVYMNADGVPTPMTYEVKTSVPENAVFTDTKYTSDQGSGINIGNDNKITNTGVRGFVTSKTTDANGTLRVNVNGVESTVTPKGLNTGAFKAVDASPTTDSDNIVTSGGVKIELDKKEGKILTFKTKADYEIAVSQGKVPTGTFFVIEEDEEGKS